MGRTSRVACISESGYVRHPYCKPVAEHGLSIDYDGSKRVRLFRFKAVGKGRNENKGQYYEAYVSLRPSKSAFTLRPFFHPGSERARMRLARHLSTTARSSRQAEPAADLPREVRTREVFFTAWQPRGGSASASALHTSQARGRALPPVGPFYVNFSMIS